MSGLKRKAQELGEQGLTAAVGEVAALTVSAAVGRYDAQATVDDQLDDLKRLLFIIHSAVDAAEGVHIRSWWLRRWLLRLRDAAADGDDVLRMMSRKRQRAAMEEANNTQQTMWDAKRRAFRSAKSVLLLAVAGDEDTERLSRTVARLEKDATGISDFLKLIEVEIRESLPEPPMISNQSSAPSHISDKGYTACRRRIVLLIARRSIRQAIHKLRPATGHRCFQPQDAGRLHDLVSDIRDAVVVSDMPEVQAMHWLAEWRRGLQAVADRADRVLQSAALVAVTGGDEARLTTTQGRDEDNDDVRRTIQSVEKAAAHLGDFIKILRIYGLTFRRGNALH